MNKFVITDTPETDESNPVLYKIVLGNRYYVHKGKTLRESADRLLDDVFRGMRGKKCPEAYSKLVEFCQQHPSTYKIKLEVILNAESAKLLKREDTLYKAMKKDDLSLNRVDLLPYKPEWMLKQAFQERCENCLKTGIVAGKKTTFKFCPNCGRINK